MYKWMSKKRNQKGFTLIELVVVVAILGILAALAIPRLTGAQQTARDNTHAANLKSLESSANIALAEHGNPAAEITWTAGTTGDSVLGKTPHLRDDFVSDWPTSPYSGGSAYTVTITTGGVVTVSGGVVTP